MPCSVPGVELISDPELTDQRDDPETLWGACTVLIPLVLLHCYFKRCGTPGLSRHYSASSWSPAVEGVPHTSKQTPVSEVPGPHPTRQQEGRTRQRAQGPAMPRRPSTIASLPPEKDQGNPTGVLLEHAAMAARGERAAGTYRMPLLPGREM